MDVVSSLPAFLIAVVLISASPGPAMALIIRRAALRGMGGAVPVVLGLEAGLYVWVLLAGAGFAALVAASQFAYLVLRVVGAAVLLVLGVRAWRTAWRGGSEPDTVGESTTSPTARRWWTAFAEGLLVQLANPKAAVFMIAFYPQFVPADGPGVRHDSAAGSAPDHPGDGPLPGAGRRRGPGRGLVPAAADPPAPGRGQRDRPRRPRAQVAVPTR